MGLNRQEDLMELLADQQEEALQLMRAREARERYAAEAPARAAAAAAEEARQAEQHTANVNAGKHLDVCTVLVAGTVGDTFRVVRADEYGMDLRFEIAPPAFQPASLHHPDTPEMVQARERLNKLGLSHRGEARRGWMWLDKAGIPAGVEVRRTGGIFGHHAEMSVAPSFTQVGRRQVREDRHVLIVTILYKQPSQFRLPATRPTDICPWATASRRWVVVSEDGRYWSDRGRWIPTTERLPAGVHVDAASRHWHDGFGWVKY